MPLTISVIVCSTWMRVFISRKKNSSPETSVSIVPDAVVGDRARGAHAGRAEPLAQTRGDRWPGVSSYQFLMAALQRTVALADVHDGAVLVGEDLHLDVLGVVEIAFA
jgi:hypothetical protein